MTKKLKNRILYWLMAIVPFGSMCLATEIVGSFWFFVFLLVYILTYRPAIDAQRLLSLNAIEEKDAWRFFIPFAIDRTRYMRILWLG